jgi:hypothetical protein
MEDSGVDEKLRVVPTDVGVAMIERIEELA